jgi:hypothetical protein
MTVSAKKPLAMSDGATERETGALLVTQGFSLQDGYPKSAAIGASGLLKDTFAVTFPDGRFLLIIKAKGDVYLAKTTATANDCPIEAGTSLSLVMTGAVASALALYAAVATRASLFVLPIQ